MSIPTLKLHVDRGDFVKEGQLLVEIDDQELKASAEQARAALVSSQAGLEVARSTLDGQKANLENQRANLAKARAVAANDARQADRMKTLFDKGMVAAADWDNARTNADSSRAGTDAAEAQLRLADVQITTQESHVRLAQAQVETFRAAMALAQGPLVRFRVRETTPPHAGTSVGLSTTCKRATWKKLPARRPPTPPGKHASSRRLKKPVAGMRCRIPAALLPKVRASGSARPWRRSGAWIRGRGSTRFA